MLVFIKSHSTVKTGDSLKSRVYVTRSKKVINQYNKQGWLCSSWIMCHCGKSIPQKGRANQEYGRQNWKDHCKTSIFHFPFRGLPSGTAQSRGTVHTVCGPLLAVVCHLLICAAVFVACKVKQPSIFPHSLLLFQCILVHENMKCSVYSAMLQSSKSQSQNYSISKCSWPLQGDAWTSVKKPFPKLTALNHDKRK